MIAAELRIAGAEVLAQAFDHAPELVERHLVPAVVGAQALLWREVLERTPTAQGTLRESIIAGPVAVDAGVVSAAVTTASPYALPVELGTRPHKPPIEPIVAWVHTKLGKDEQSALPIAEAIAWKIYRQGTPAAHMFEGAFEANQAQVEAMLAAAVAAIAADLGRAP